MNFYSLSFVKNNNPLKIFNMEKPMRTILLLLFAFCFIIPIGAQTPDSSNGSGYWGNPSTWQSGKVPGLNDDIIIRPQDVVTIGYQVTNNTALCHNLTVLGTLTFTNDIYGSPGRLYSTGTISIDYYGTIAAAKDTSFVNMVGTSSIYAGNGLSNYGTFTSEVDNSYGKRVLDVDINGGTLDLYQNTKMNRLDITGNVNLVGKLSVNNLYLYKNLYNSNGQLKINNNGGIWRSDSGSIAVAPTFGQDIYIQYANSKKITTGPELPRNVYSVSVSGDLQLDKTIHVMNLFKFPYTSSYSHVYTGSDTVLIEDNASINLIAGIYGNYIVGNLAQVYASKDSLVFPIGTPGKPRPVAIKLNNLSSAPVTITVSADSSVNLTSLPAGVAAIEKDHYWNISASSNYSGKVDANVSLQFTPTDAASINPDLVGNEEAITVLHGNNTTGQWDMQNNIIDSSSTTVYTTGAGSYEYVTGHFTTFGSFTTGNIYEIPNGSFEYWQYGWPYSWTPNDTYVASPIKSSTDAHGGSAAVEGDVTDSAGTLIPPILKTVLPFNIIPKALQGYYKFNSVNDDKFYVTVKLFKDSNVVAQGSYIDSVGSSSYKLCNLDVTSNQQVNFADSMEIEVTIKPGSSNALHNGSQYIIDDFTMGSVTGVEADRHTNNLPAKFTLYQNYPNPFNPSTKIKFDLTENSSVNLVIYNILGEDVKTLINKNFSAGEHIVTFNANNLASGIYFYRIKTTSESGKEHLVVKKMILLK